MLFDLFFPFEFFAVLAEFFKLVFFSFAFGTGFAFSFLGHVKLVFEAAFHVFGGFALGTDGGVLFL